MGVPNARKMDRLELRNTLEGTEHGNGAGVRNKVRKKGEMQNIYRRGERLDLSLCAVPSPRRMWGSFDLQTEQGLQNTEGIVSGVVTQARKRCYTWRSLVLCSAQHQNQSTRKTQRKVRAQLLGKGELLRVRYTSA